MRKTFCIDDILARVYPEEKVGAPIFFGGKRILEECRVEDQNRFYENNNNNTNNSIGIKTENNDDMDYSPKLERSFAQTNQHLTEQFTANNGSLKPIETHLVDSFKELSEHIRPSPPLTPSLDPELLRRLEAEDTPKRVLRASTVAMTKNSLARKEFTYKRQKRKVEPRNFKPVKAKIAKCPREKRSKKRFDTPIEVKISDEALACTPSSSGVSSMSSTSSAASVKGRGRKKLQQKVLSNWRPVTAGEKHYTYYSNDNAPVKRLCFPAVQHNTEPETIRIHDAVIVNSEDGSRNIGKVARIFLDDKTGLLMATVFWYYSSEQVEIDEKNIEPPICGQELLASRHIDVIPIDTIQEVVFVLTVNEYNRYVAENKIDALPREERPRIEDEVWPRAENAYFRRSSLPCEDSLPELVYFCRRIYDFKQKRITTNRPGIAKKVVFGRKIMSGKRMHKR